MAERRSNKDLLLAQFLLDALVVAMSGHRSHYPHPRAGQGETKTGKISLIKEIRYIPYGIFGLYGKIQKKTLYEWQIFFLGPN